MNILSKPTGERVPVFAISKLYVCKCGCLGRCSWDAVFKVLNWSFRALLAGKHPEIDPAGQMLQDEFSKGLAGKDLGFHAFLMQFRGDWPFLKSLFSFPSWSSSAICWCCKADKGEHNYKNCGENASWRKLRVSAEEFFRLLRAMGLTPSPLFEAPGMRLAFVLLDWLHVVDLGVLQDLLGCLFMEAILHGLDGRNKEIRLKKLWDLIKEYYEITKPPCRLDMLTEEMFHTAKKSPKLKAKGAETRHLLPFGALFAKQMANKHQTQHWQAVASVFHFMLECAKCIATVPFEFVHLRDCSRKLCVQWGALEDEAISKGLLIWVRKPKFHLFQELREFQAEEFGSPESFWTYRDESWCGHMATAAKRRGGQKHASTGPERLLSRFRAMQTEDVNVKL